MLRRSIITAACGLTFCADPPALAQTAAKVWRIGVLSQRHVDFVDSDYVYGPFVQGLGQLGYALGRNVLIEWRSGEGKVEPLLGLAEELVRLKVDVLLTSGTPASLAAQNATRTIPIVLGATSDPVGRGLVQSLGRPGGNITGLSVMSAELTSKLLELLLVSVPKLSRVAVLINPANAGVRSASRSQAQDFGTKTGVNIHVANATSPQEIEIAFEAMAKQRVGALLVTLEPFFQQQKSQIVELAAKYRLPSIGGYGEFAEAGGLMSYGPSLRENYRRAATYVDKILRGANPGDLPVEQPTTIEFFINLKTAKTLAISLPQSVLLRATKLVE